jgi:hypothetical protein
MPASESSQKEDSVEPDQSALDQEEKAKEEARKFEELEE